MDEFAVRAKELEQGIGHKLLNLFGDRLPNSARETGIEQNFQNSLLISLFAGNPGLNAVAV